VIILVIIVILMISIFCCYNEYRRRRRDPSLSLNDTIEQNHQEPSSLLEGYYPQSPRSPSPSPGPQLWINSLRRWKNFRQGPPTYGNTQTPAVPSVTITSTEEPPAYEGISFIFLSLSEINFL
jgi:hypothetical protein